MDKIFFLLEITSSNQLRKFKNEILDEIEDEIIAFAESSPEPRVDELEKYTLAENDPWVYGGGR